MASYLDGLVYDPDSENAIQETRGGVPLCSGLPHELHHWKFRVESRILSTEAEPEDQKREQKMKELGSKLLDGLSGDALQIAMDLGARTIIAAEGPRKLLEALETNIIVLKQDEGRDLYKYGIRHNGPLSRQLGESVMNYLTRRCRWYDRVKVLNLRTS